MTKASDSNKIKKIMQRSFGVEALNIKAGMDLYNGNAFRILGISSLTPFKNTETAIASFNNKLRLMGDKAVQKTASKLGRKVKSSRVRRGSSLKPGIHHMG